MYILTLHIIYNHIIIQILIFLIKIWNILNIFPLRKIQIFFQKFQKTTHKIPTKQKLAIYPSKQPLLSQPSLHLNLLTENSSVIARIILITQLTTLIRSMTRTANFFRKIYFFQLFLKTRSKTQPKIRLNFQCNSVNIISQHIF